MWAISEQDTASNDWLICNNLFDSWYLPVYPISASSRWTIWGNRFTHSGLDAYLGELSGLTIDSNYFDNNGDNNNSFFNHVIYVGAADGPVTNVSIVNNEFHRSEGAAGGTPGSMIVMHGQVTGPTLIQNNVVDAGPNPTIYAIGIAPTNGGYGMNEWFRNVTIRGNWLTGFPGGNGSIITDCATNMLVENNVVVQTQGGYAINTPYQACPQGDASANITVRNNTVYYPSGQSGTGIAVENQGTGHVLANNSISATTSGGTCFSTGLASSAYTFVGHNACYGGTWGTSYDATTHITANPLYTNAPSSFTLQATSPLIGAGSAAYGSTVDFNDNARPNPPSIGAYE
jgi:hypothetical protein